MRFGLRDHDDEPLDYGGYLRIPDLLSLQELRSDPARHDETLFIIIHQTYELWFKQILHELGAVLAHLEAGEALGAYRLLRRCVEIQRVLVQQVDVLETMTPTDFLSFRDHLRPASGFQSAQFREIEFLAGLRDARYLESYHAASAERARLGERLAARSLNDAYYALLAARGHDLPAEPDAGADHERRLRALEGLYRDPHPAYDLFLLAESLIEFDEMFALWRLRHVKMVERIIGPVTGTGGSEGAGYLWKTVGRRFFPELWEVRSRLGEAEPA